MRGSFCILVFSENLPASYYVLCGGSGRLQLESFCQSLIRPCSAAPIFQIFPIVAVVEDRALDGDQRITPRFPPGLGAVLFLLENFKTGGRICGTWYAETISLGLLGLHDGLLSHLYL
jgi:hypothetical protein